MQEQFNLTLPLAIGTEAAKSHQNHNQHPSQTISTSEIECNINFQASLIQSAIKQQNKNFKLNITDQTILNNLLQIKLGEFTTSSEQINSISIGPELKNTQQKSFFPFRISLAVNERELSAKIIKTVMEFKVISLPKHKFVNNEKLQNIVKCQHSEWGLMTMDQSHRIVLQGQESQFPSIGFWLTGKTLQPLVLAEKITQYCSLKIEKKCKFTFEGKKYFYLVRCYPESKTPQLYLVQWTSPKETITTLEYILADYSPQEEIIIRSDQHSHLEFTLRSDEKIPQKLQNIQYSPILFHEQNSSFNLSPEEPNSPRFKQTNNYQNLELQCSSLRRLVKMQQEEINQLRAELMRVTRSIRRIEIKQPSKSVAKNIKPCKGKILTEKDLSLGSPSDHPSTSTSSNEMPQDWNVWDRFVIIDK